MRKIIVTGIAVLLVGGGWFAWNKLQSKAQQSRPTDVPKDAVVISMNQDDYAPSEITVSKGSTVVFVNKSTDWRWPASNLHPTHDIYPEFDPKEPVAPGASWSFRFEKSGAWRMHDHLAPYITGTITVKE